MVKDLCSIHQVPGYGVPQLKDAAQQEEQLFAVRRGKWSQAGVPHRGWHCVDIEDLGAPDWFCEMCESQMIRYVHHMEHPNFEKVLCVGCVCAGHMEEDIAGARLRETSMKNRASKRKRWLSRNWKISRKGNPWLNADGYRVTVYQGAGGWAAAIGKGDDTHAEHIRRSFPSQDQAKLAAFDHITRLLAGKT